MASFHSVIVLLLDADFNIRYYFGSFFPDEYDIINKFHMSKTHMREQSEDEHLLDVQRSTLYEEIDEVDAEDSDGVGVVFYE
jgi:hypothetical protein